MDIGVSAGARVGGEAIQLINAKIWIENNEYIYSNKHDVFADSLLIVDGKIAAVGKEEEVNGIAKQHNAKQVNIGGRLVIPGLIDSHLHFSREGMNFNMELRWDGVTSLKAALDMLHEQAKRTPSGQWVRVVGGFSEHQFDEKRLPTIAELDAAGMGRVPIFILHLYDRALVNGVGLKVLGYDQNTANPPGGEIQRDPKTGQPTGVLIAKPNAFLLYNTLNQLPKLSESDQFNSTLAYQYELNRLGVTSVMDPGGGFQRFPEDYGTVQSLDKSRQLTVKVSYSLFPQKAKHELEDFQRWSKMVKPGDGSRYLRHLGAGEMLAFSAADFEDFQQPRPDLPSDMESDMEAIVKFLLSIRWPFRLHATYGESIERELALFEKIDAEPAYCTNGGIGFQGLRWIIDHAETISKRDIERIHKLGGNIAIQHRMAFQGEYFVQRYGKSAASHSPPIGHMLDVGVGVGAGTDGTRVATYNPWVSLSWLVNGNTVGNTVIYGKDNIVSRGKALQLWTSSNAYLANSEKEKGSIKVGLAADLTILSDDYFTIPSERIKDLESVCTFVDGRVVYATEDMQKRLSSSSSPVASTLLKAITPSWSPVTYYGGYQSKSTTAWNRYIQHS